jgi:preprotein translocase subunit Sec63
MDKGQIMSKLLKYLRVVVLIILWGSLVLFIYWTLTQEQESVEWDPFEILQIDRVHMDD